MVGINVSKCPDCGKDLKYYDKVRRIVRTKGRATWHVLIRRLRCSNCEKIHRELPACVVPYKQYEAELIKGVLEGIITPETIGYEDYPCEMTMDRWTNSQKLQDLLRGGDIYERIPG